LSLLGGRLVLGGYTSLNLHFLSDKRDALVLDDLAAFVTLRLTDSLRLFAEIELEDALEWDGSRVDTNGHAFSTERLYGEWQPNDWLRLRVGKMLTPIGIWNSIHAAPLVWTTTRPLATTEFFDTGVTGAQADLFHHGRNLELRATAFAQITEHFDDPGDTREFREAGGGRLEIAGLNGPALGLSYVRFKNDSAFVGTPEDTWGADFLWSLPAVELSSEFALNQARTGGTTWSVYFQAVAHGPCNLHPFVRVEHGLMEERGERFTRTPVVFGVAWQPMPAMVFKLEGLTGGSRTALGGAGVLTSWSMLF
jgi:hypothetical protein